MTIRSTEELLEGAGQALAADAALTQWCIARFGRPATIFIGIDEADPPKAEDFPLIAIVGIDQARGIFEKEERWILSMGIGVLNEDIPTSGNIRTRAGFVQAEALRELAENAIYRAHLLPAGSTGEASSFCDHPLYISFTAISLKKVADRRGLF